MGNRNARLNPTLAVQAYFLVPGESDLKRSQFDLQDYPEIALWLLSIVDHLDSRLGKLKEARRINDPPGGTARKLLIDGGVLLAEQGPRGGLVLRLNKRADMGLYIYARRHGLPAVDVAVSLGEDLGLSRWLLTLASGGGASVADDDLRARLGRYAILVDELPADDVCFPDPAAPVDLAGELATASRLIHQPAGAGLPVEVRQLLGGHKPALPAATGLVWGQDAGTGLVFPTVWSGARDRLHELEELAGRDAPARREQWARQREMAGEMLRVRKYAVLREILPPAQRLKLRDYVRKMDEHGYFPELGVDQQVARRASIHKQQTLASLQPALARLLGSIAGQPMMGTFCQLGLYEEGAVLERHRDRPQCVLNLSMVIDMQGAGGDPDPWPICLAAGGETVSVDLQPGDGLLYSGVEIEHWRDALPVGQRAIVGFFFFAPPDFKGTLN